MKMRRKKILAMFLAFSIVLQQGGVAEVTTAGRTVQAEETASAPDAEALAAPATETASAPDMEASAVSAEETASAPDTEASAAPAEKTASATDTEASSVPLTEAPAQNQTDNAAEPEFIIDPVYVQQSDSSVPQQETTETLPDVNENVQPELKLDNAAQTDADHTLPYIALELTRPDGFPADADWKLELLNEEEKTGLTADINMNLADGLVLRFSVEQNGSACDIAGAKAVFDGLDDSYLADGHLSMYRNGVWEELSAVFFEDAGRVRASFPLDAIGILCFWKPVQPQESETEAPETKETETEAKKEETEETETETKKEETEETETETKKEEAEETETETKKEEAEETETKKEETEETETETKQEETEETETEEAETNKGQSDIPQMEGPGMDEPGMEDSGVEEPGTNDVDTYSVYEILYSDGEMVFQTNAELDAEKAGKGPYYVFHDDGSTHLDGENVKWDFEDYKNQITSVTFREDVPLASLECIFKKCENLEKVEIGSFTASEVKRMGWAFYKCGKLTSLDLSRWRNAPVTYMKQTFADCTNLQNLNVANWNTMNLDSLYWTFQNCGALKSIDVKNWNTGKVTNMIGTFLGCSSLTALDLSGWNTSNVRGSVNIANFFKNCNSLSEITLGSSFMFKNASASGVGLSGYWKNESNEVYSAEELVSNYKADMAGKYVKATVCAILYQSGELVFQNDEEPETTRGTVDKIYTDVGKNASTGEWPFHDAKDKITSVTFRDNVKLDSLNSIFDGCTELQKVNTEKFDATGVRSLARAFYNCTSLTKLNLSNWDVSAVTDMTRVFEKCKALRTLEISNWDTSSVTSVFSVFRECTSLIALDVSGWDTSKVGNMQDVFYGCTQLTELDMSGWTTAASNADPWRMFYNCAALQQLRLNSAFVTAKETYLSTPPPNPPLPDKWKALTSKVEYTSNELLTSTSKATDTYVRAVPITFHGNGGTPDQTKVDAFIEFALGEDKWNLVTEPTYAGYEFDGWWTASEDGEQLTAETPVTQTDYYAHWKKDNVYEIFYKKTGELVLQNTDDVDQDKADPENPDEYTIYKDDGSNALAGNENWDFDAIKKDIKSVTFRDNVKLKTVQFIFKNCTNLQIVNTGEYDAAGVTSIAQAFNGCEKLTSLDLSKWDVSSAANIGHVFQNCKNLVKLNVSTWNTASANNMFETFAGCSSLVNLDVSGWNTSLVTNLIRTFKDCSSLKELNLNSWNTTTVSSADMSGMFAGCNFLSRLTFGSSFQFRTNNAGLTGFWQKENNTEVVYTAEELMMNPSDLAGTYVRPRVYEILYESGEMVFQNDNTPDPSKGDVYRIYEDDGSNAETYTNCSWEFQGDKSRITSVSFRDNVKLKSLCCIFDGCGNLASVDTGKFDASSVSNMNDAFRGCTSLVSLNLGGWDTSRVTNVAGMFQNCTSLVSINGIESWNTSNVSSVNETFAGCSSLLTLNLQNWNTEKVGNDKWRMFYECRSLVKLTLGSGYAKKGRDADTALPDGWMKKTGEDVFVGNASTGKPYTGAELTNQEAENIAGSYYRTVRISFNGNGGAASQQGADGYLDMKIAGEDIPTAIREGYTFAGWFTDPAGGEQLNAGDVISQLMYYAHWTPYTYTLCLYPQTGNAADGKPKDEIKTQTLRYADFYQLSENLFTNEGKFLIGWNTRSDGQGKMYDPNARVSGLADQDGSTVNLYAIWGDPDDYAWLSFDAQGGTDVASMRVKKGVTLNQDLPQSMREGYEFLYWSKDTEGRTGSVNGYNLEITGDMTLYAIWERYLTATFNPCIDGLAPTTMQTTARNPLKGSLPSYPQREDGRTLIGWFTAETGGEQVRSGETYLTDDTEFFAHWGWKPQFETAGGKFTTYPEMTYVEGKSDYTFAELPKVERDGYKFDGWYWEYTEESIKKEKKIELNETVDLAKGTRIVAHWSRLETAELTLNPNGGTVNGKKDNVILHSYCDSPVGDLPIPERDGYVFQGWYDEDGVLCSSDSEFDKNTKLTAQWAEEVYVTFMDGNTVVEQLAVAKDGTIASLPGTSKGDTENPKILVGWYADPGFDESTKLTTSTNIAGNTVYYAKWRELNNTQTSGGITYTYGIEWNSASNENVDNVGDRLVFHPTDYRDQTASLHIHLQMNVDDNTGKKTIPEGAIQIRIPQYVWKNWEGAWEGDCNISSSLPSSSSGANFSYKKQGNDYILYNVSEISGGAGIDLTISYTVTPSKVPGGGIDAAGNYVIKDDNYYHEEFPVGITINTGSEEEKIEFENNIAIEMHTRVNTFASKEFSKLRYSCYDVWQKEWGEIPADADDYFYIEWKLKETVQTTTNQPFTFSWSEENTVHDGTVVGFTKPETDVDNPSGYQVNDSKVVVKYPLSMLDEAVDGKLNIHNEAIVTENWKSGYKTSHRVSANYTVDVPKSTGGERGFEKFSFDTKNNANVNAPAQKHGGQEDILDDQAEVSLGWRISYSGGPENTPTWNAEKGTYSAEARTISISDGTENNLLYSSGNAKSRYVWEPTTGNTKLSDEDYRLVSVQVDVTEYDAKPLNEAADKWTGIKEHIDRDDYEDVDIYVRCKDSHELEFFRRVKSGEKVFLPENVRGIQILHDSAFYWTDVRVDLTANLKPSDTVTRLIMEDVWTEATSIIKNWAHCQVKTKSSTTVNPYVDVKDYDENGYAVREVWELDVSDTYQYLCKSAADRNKVVTNVNHGIQDNPMCLTGWLYNNSKRIKRLRTGIFYDLLPQGTTVDPASVYGIWFAENTWNTPGSPGRPANNYYTKLNDPARLPRSAYDVEFVNNWEGSKRTMMIIRFTMPEEIRANGLHIYYLLRTTYENIMENGTTQENDAAFVNTTRENGPPDGTGNVLDVLKAKNYFKNLDEEYSGKICYYEDSTHYVPVDVSTWGFDKQVKAETGTSYGQSDTSLLNNLYTYRLVYSQGSGTKTKNIVFFDVLENGFYEKKEDVPGGRELLPSQWKGTFVDINVESVRNNRMDEANPQTACNPVIYYSTEPREKFADVRPELKDTEVWTTTMPDDPSQVTAIAVDCSTCINETPFELTGKVDALEIYITMRAPQEVKEGEDITRNRAAVYMTHVSSENKETSVMMDAGASVTLKDVDPELHKTSDPGSGTKEAPAPVYKDDPLTYTLSVTNTGKEAPLKNIVVEDTIPGGLSVQNNGIRVRFDDDKTSMLVSESPRVDLTRNGQKLTFTIRSLNAGETAYIEIIGTVTADAETVLENQAHITSVNDVHKNLDSETTYHKVIPIGFNIFKVGAGRRPIKGAVLQLWKKAEGADPDEPLDETTDTYKEEWESDGKEKTFSDLEHGIYIIHEVEAPAGHLLAEDIVVKLDEHGNLTRNGELVHGVTMQDDWTQVRILKKNPTGYLIEGAALEIYEREKFDMETKKPEDGAAPVARWTTTDKPYELDGVLNPNTDYVLYEEKAPEGYRQAEPKEFSLGDGKTLLTVEMEDPFASFEVRVKKTDPDGALLPKAKLRITGRENGSSTDIIPIEWVTTKDDQVVKLYPGTYTLSEVYAPNGYAVADPIVFTVEEDVNANSGIVKVEGEIVETATLVMTDKRTQELTVTKTVLGEETVASSGTGSGTEKKQYYFTLKLTSDGKPFTAKLAYRKESASGTTTSGVAESDTESGIYEFQLAGGESITFLEVPEELDYVVNEISEPNADYVATIENGKGKTTSAEPTRVTVTNTYPNKGDLLISKTVIGTWAPPGETYTVQITPGAGKKVNGSNSLDSVKVYKMSSGTKEEMTAPNAVVTDSKITVKLAGGEQIVVMGLAPGDYTVTETGSDPGSGAATFTTKYKVNGGEESKAANVYIDTNTIGNVEVLNTYQDLGELIIEKTVKGTSEPDDGTWYNIQVRSTAAGAFAVSSDGTKSYQMESLTDAADESGGTAGSASDAQYQNERVANGVLYFQLRKGSRIIITGLPTGVYTVSETGVDPDCSVSYTVSVNDSAGTSGNIVTLRKQTSADDTAVQSGTVSILNRYPDSTSLTLSGTKAVIGKSLEAGKYHFAINVQTNPGGGAVLPENAEAVNSGAPDGQFSFNPIKFRKKGTYVFQVRETRSDDPAVGTDGTVYRLTVTVEIEKTEKVYRYEITRVEIARIAASGDGTAEIVATYEKAADGEEAGTAADETAKPIPDDNGFILPTRTEGGKTASFINRAKRALEMPDTGGPGTLPLTRISLLLCLAGAILLLLAKRRKPRGPC